MVVQHDRARDGGAHEFLGGDLRLDQRAALTGRLGLASNGDSPTDDELVLAAYGRWGDRCTEHLDGDYAFAVWDPRRRRVFCARDPFGVKPFSYQLSDRTFTFASSPEEVLRASDGQPELNPRSLVEYLFGFFGDAVSTPYTAVSRLPAGHTLVVEPDRHECRRHWDPASVAEWGGQDDAVYEEAFRAALTEAVTERLPPGEAGLYLSGGLDSSSIACLAGGRLVALSAVFDDEPQSDERSYAAATAAQAGSRIVYCRPEQTSPLADWPGSPGRWPTPSCEPQAAIGRVITEAAHANGIPVLLSGFGGDSVVSHGPAYLSELVRSGRIGQFAVEVRAIARRHERPVWPLVKAYGLRPQLPRTVLHRRRAGQLTSGPVPVRTDVAARFDVPDLLADQAVRAAARTARQAHSREFTSGHLALALEGSFAVDRATGVERRYPFLDRRLAELCLSLPGDQKLRDGWTRSILRRSLVGVLPEAVRLRVGKSDLTHGFRRSLLGADRQAIESLVARPDAVAEWVDPAALEALWHRCRDGATGPHIYALWRVASLASWLTHHGFAGDPVRT